VAGDLGGGELDPLETVLELVEQALSAAGLLETVFALLRVEGLRFGPDPLVMLSHALDREPREAAARYWELASNMETLGLLANLAWCAGQQSFKPLPFARPTDDEAGARSIREAAEATANALAAVRQDELSALVLIAYSEQALVASQQASGESLGISPPDALEALERLLKATLAAERDARRRFIGQPALLKLPQFEVLELLIHDVDGLYGFRVHFSNGSTAEFERGAEHTSAMNIILGSPINFMVEDLDALKPEWYVGGRPLYETGLPGRYNLPGSWKPIIFPGDPADILSRVRSLSEDPDVQGAIFYVMATGHRVIEFVVRTPLELPIENVGLGEHLRLFKCSPKGNGFGGNIRVYDGTFTLESVQPDFVRRAIATIGVGVNRLAFACGAGVDWRTKYSTHVREQGFAIPSEGDLELLDSVLKEFPATEDSIVLDAAIDWFNRGRSSRNVFVSFLSFYIAFESVAAAIADGEADLGVQYKQVSKEQRRARRRECIEVKHDALYAIDSVRFVSEAYFDCVVGLKKKTRRVAELVFGVGHPALAALFERSSQPSLSDIRGALAHGVYTLLDIEHEQLVRQRLREIEQITREFLTRLIFQLSADTPIPTWAQEHSISVSMGDPRTTLYATAESILPTTDWTIRAEWCD
jgi:hypothetical protein